MKPIPLKNNNSSLSLRHFGQVVLLLTPADGENGVITEDGTQRIFMHSNCRKCPSCKLPC